MSIQEDTFLRDNLNQILELLSLIVQKSAGESYIYRGESKHFDKVSSNLYRQYGSGRNEEISIDAVQEEILEDAKKYTTETDRVEILSELQHYGGKTNLIDFTTDYLTALFFACDGFPLEDGRLILLAKTGVMAPYIYEPRRLTNRVVVQKSVFVIPPEGFVEPDDVVSIPKELKEPLLEYLRHSHNISVETVYNDLHGFIRRQKLHADAYRELHLAVTYHKEDEPDLQHSIDHYTRAVALNPRLAQAYCGRGGAYYSKGEYDRAIQDLSRAISLEEDHSCAYANRGRVYLEKDDPEQAISDLSRAIELNQDFTNDTTSTAHFSRGLAYLEQDQFDLAIQDFDLVLDRKLTTDIAAVHHNRGCAYLYASDLDAAVKDFDRAIELEPDAPAPCFVRGTAHAYNGDYIQAIKDLDRVIQLSPDHSGAYHNRGVTRLLLADWEAARTDFEIAKSMGVDIASTFCDDFESVAEFEKRFGVAIPEDLATMLDR